MALSRAAPIALSVIRTRVRDECQDPATFATGQAIAEGQRRFTDAQINTAIEDALIDMGNHLAGVHPGHALLSVELEYDGTDGMDLPAAIGGADRIFKVEDATDTIPFVIEYVSPADIENYAEVHRSRPFRYTIVGDAVSGTSGHPNHQIQIRPKVSARTFRISYIAPPVIPGADGDLHTYTGVWRDLVTLLAARKLLSWDDEFTAQQEGRLQDTRRQFKQFSMKVRTRMRVPQRRKGRS